MKKAFRKMLSGIAICAIILVWSISAASAAVLFQDDNFEDVLSDALRIGSNDAGVRNTAIQFGNDAIPTENGTITWNISTNSFSIDHSVDITGGLSATGNVNFSSATQVRLRESANPTTSAACANVNELIINTTLNRVEICTATGAAGAATWVAMPAGNATTLGGLTSSQFLRRDTSSNLTSGTLTTNSGTTLQVNGAANFSGATSFIMAQGTSNPATCSVGQLFYNTTTNLLNVCTATNTWTTAGPQDFESVYSQDADKTLTTSNGNFTISRGSGSFSVTGTGSTTLNESTLTSTSTGATTFNSGAASSSAIGINATNAAGGITASWGTGGLNFSSSTGSFSVSGAGASTINTTGGNLNLNTTTSGNVVMNSAGTITFKDSALSSAVKLNNTQTGLNATFPAGAGILDALNSFTSTAAGDGASNVGVSGTFTNFTPATPDVQAALAAIDSKIGSGAPNSEDLTFYPLYPDYVIAKDGSNNNGTMEADYDSTNNEHYYRWSTNNASLQDMDLKFRFPLPADFASVGNLNFRFRTGTTTAASNKLDITLSNATDLTTGRPTVCASSAGNASGTANTWATATITNTAINTGCTGATALNAGDIVEVDVKLYDLSGATTWADAGFVKLLYNN